MIRNLKVLGLALAAVFAMSAFVASSASAQTKGWLTSDGPVKLTGADVGKSILTYNDDQKLECNGHYHVGNYDETPHDLIEPPETYFTVAPTYTNCVGVVGGTEVPATVTMNGCDYELQIGNTIEEGLWGGSADVVCGGNEIEVHVYSSSSHGSTICTYKFAAQTGKTGGTVQNVANGDITLGGAVQGIHASRTGILCGGNNTTNNAQLDIDAVVSGTDKEGGPTDISVTD